MITNNLQPELILLDVYVKSREEIIDQLAKIMGTKGVFTDPDAYLEQVYKRERNGSTAIGFEVAIPHGKSKGVAKPTVAFARLANPITWDGEETVSLVFLIAVPEEEAGDEHLKILASLSRKLIHEEFRQLLKTAATKAEIFAALTDMSS
jgi:fructose-specific phosphotransferase system IIA component